MTDECGNENSCFFEIVVVNDDPPHAVCDQFTTVSLQDNGWARMLPISLDDGSYDPCGEEISFKAKRMDIQPCSGEPDFEPLSAEEIACDNYREFVQFCCADAGLYIPVSLLVTDASGNTAECTVQVLVQDKTPFNGTPPTPTANISCDQYDEDTIYGNEPTAGNGCGAYTLDHEDTPNLDDCGNGTVTRRWFYVIGGVNVYLPETQIITISAVNFTVTMPAGPVTADCSTYTTDLGDEPRINGQPISNYDGCASLAWTYEDQEFKGIEGFCLKVIRTWTVLDHCVYDANSGSLAGYYQDTQVIYVNNDTAPTVSNCPEDMWYDPAPGTCSASVTLTGPDAVDACFGEQIDDSGYSYVVTDFFTGQVITSGTGRTDVLPLNLAAYVVTWTVEDDCGNTNSDCSHIVDVIDEKAPTPYCYGGITTVVMDGEFTQNGEPSIEIWASDFNIGSFDNCTDSIDLVYSFSSDITDTNMTYNCDSIGLKNVTIYVFDESGNYDFCETTVFIQANGETCDNGLLPRIAGKVETEDNRDVEDVDISLEAMTTNTMNYNFTNAQGLYAFDNTVWAEDYHIEAAKNDNYLNGVSTLDIVLIQRHILGIQALNSPYKMIAADANNSSSVSSIDLIELRKLILGIYSELPANDSWRFVDATETFSDINNPWPFTEDIDINQINADMMSNNFVGVKVGDVNGSVSLNIHDNEVDNRSNTTLRLIKDNTSFEAGEKVAVEITAHNFDQIFGMQYTIEFNQALLSFDNITSGALNIDANNLGLFNATEGQIGLSWNGAGSTATSVAQDQVLFTLWFNAKQTGNTSSLNISSSITNIEAYDNALQTMNVSLENRNLEQDYLTLYQNTPNPFNNSTEIGFSLPKAGNVVFEVYDVTGKVIKKSIEFHQKGYNSILFSTNDIKVDGVLYYKISTELETATKKMLLIH